MTKDTNTSVVEQNNDTKPADNQNVDNKPAVNQGNDSPENMIPYARFNELNKNYKTLQEEMTKMKDSQEQRRTKQMEEQGKFKELNAELVAENQKLKEQNGLYVAKEQQERETLLGKLSEDDQAIYGDLSTNKLKKHIEFIEKKSSIPTDKSKAIRGNVLPEDKDIFKMSGDEAKKNWTAYLNKFKK
jgi:hypothetical protein